MNPDSLTAGTEPHELSRDECLALLGTARSGRLLLHAGELRVTVPVTVVARRGEVEVCPAAGGLLPAVRAMALVGVEVQASGVSNGWSVTAMGRAGDGGPPSPCLTLPVELVFGSRTGRGPLTTAAPEQPGGAAAVVPAPRAAPAHRRLEAP